MGQAWLKCWKGCVYICSEMCTDHLVLCVHKHVSNHGCIVYTFMHVYMVTLSQMVFNATYCGPDGTVVWALGRFYLFVYLFSLTY